MSFGHRPSRHKVIRQACSTTQQSMFRPCVAFVKLSWVPAVFAQSIMACPSGPKCNELAAEIFDLQRREEILRESVREAQKALSKDRRRLHRIESITTAVFLRSGGNKRFAEEYYHRHLPGEDSSRLDAVLAAASASSATPSPALSAPPSASRSRTRASVSDANVDHIIRDQQLREWVRRCNEDQGIAPVSGHVHQQAVRLGCHRSRGVPPKRKSALQWVRRWRRRWNVVLGKVQARDIVPPEEMHEKVMY